MSESDRSNQGPHTETPLWGAHHAFQTPKDLTGTTLGDFHVERKLGQGGMGEVYLATQLSLNRPVALKVLRPDLLANPTYLSRFETEAWAAAKLNHPNIVHIYSLGCIDNVRFIAMEYVRGTNLREYIEKKGPPELPLALSIMRQAGVAVGAAGEVGLVHRDIKPENLLLTRKGQVKVADFGLCRDKEGQHLHLTQEGVTLGTPMYMSPEQVQGRALDHRSDLYSLGVTFYHMLAGSPPFRAETALALALKHVRDEPVSLAVHRPDLPEELVALVMKLMAKDPPQRYASAAEMLRDLARLKEALHTTSEAVSLPEVSVPTPVAVSAPEEPGASIRERLVGVQVSGALVAAVIAVSMVLGAVGGWMARAENLVAENADEPHAPPGVWMAPWRSIPAQPSPEAQYHYAQFQAVAADQEAAWLAVPGRFRTPQAAYWSYNAYTQLVRYLFQHHDAASLEALAPELERSERQHEEKTLARVARAAASALRGDANRVLDLLAGGQSRDMDAGLAELSLEIVLSTRSSPNGAQHATALTSLAKSLQQTLKLDLLETANLAPPN